MNPNETEPAPAGPPAPARKRVGLLGVGVAAAVVALAGLGAWLLMQRAVSAPAVAAEATTGYHAVLLTNGSVYFGRLGGMGQPFLELTEVFYVQTVTDPETKKTSSSLVKRGRELHAPGKTLINAAQVLLVEPVGAESQIAQLIAESRR